MNKIESIKKEISKVVVGQSNMIDGLFFGLFCDGHILLEGVPGLAKTTTIKAFSKALGLESNRIQFTPDLLPSDIIGAEIYNPKENEFSIKKGAIFTNFLLADEINRAPAKVQSALLEAMQEKQVTIGNSSFKLPYPFIVMATQNPVESEGAYQLPEAQLDRFMLKVNIEYNTIEEEIFMADRVSNQKYNSDDEIKSIINEDEINQIKDSIQKIHIDDEIKNYIMKLIDASRFPHKYDLDEISSYISYGASPRATIDLLKVSKARAYFDAQDYVSPIQIAKVIKDVLRHRIILSYEAVSNQINSDGLIDKILQKIPIP